MSTKFTSLAALLAAVLMLGACGGSSSNSKPTPDPQTPPPSQGGDDPGDDPGEDPGEEPAPETQTGVFVDSPVAGVAYTTSPSGKSGITNAIGEYQYEEGDTVVFSIGGIVFPEVTAKGKVTPLDMGGENADLNTPAVTNVIRLLQSLDADGDPENGISITEATRTTLSDVVLDVEAATFESEATTALNTLNKVLVSSEDAVGHFQSSLQNELLGSWVYEEENGNINVLTFFTENRYVIAHSGGDDEEQSAGSAEYGRYSWNPVNGEFTTSVIRQNDGSGGLDNEEFTVTLADGQLTFTSPDEGSFDFIKVESATGGLVGAWRFLEPRADDAESGDLLTFYSATEYVFVHLWNHDISEDPQVTSEWGTYEWAQDGSFSVGEPSVDTDGPAGFYDPEENPTRAITLPGNGELVLAEDESAEAETWTRVGRYQVALQDFEGDTSSASVRFDGGRFTDKVAYSFELDVIAEGEAGTYEAEVWEQPIVHLNADGTGTMDFGDETNIITDWKVSTSGVLTIHEYIDHPDDDAFWTITPITSRTGDAVLVQQSDLNLSYIGRAKILREIGFAPADFRGLVYNVSLDGEADIRELQFDAAARTITTYNAEDDQTYGARYFWMAGGKVLQVLFDDDSRWQFAVFTGYNAEESHYTACWFDDEAITTAEQALTIALADPSECGEYFTFSEAAAQDLAASLEN